MIRRAFTLLEVMVALVLIAIASTAVSIQLRGAIEKKKFNSNLDRLKSRMFVAQKLAIATQADWTGVLKKEKDGWTFLVQTDETNGKQFSPLRLDKMELYLNGKKINSQLVFDFFSSGHTSPEGILSFKQGSQHCEWKGFDLFQRNEGKKSGPTHPSD
ncbi:MAG: type II secretion system GspH family protein [Parachlamydiales bacterium]|nr:type II secretion system GspH family protein [Parachlamydiales bacterium]